MPKFGGPAPPAALNYASRDRTAGHAERHLKEWSGILQANAYSGYNGLYDPSRLSGAIMPAPCQAHSRRQFFELADISTKTAQEKGGCDLANRAGGGEAHRCAVRDRARHQRSGRGRAAAGPAGAERATLG